MSGQERDRFEIGLDKSLVATGNEPLFSEKQMRFKKGDEVVYQGKKYVVSKDGYSYRDADDQIVVRPVNVPDGDEFLTVNRSELSVLRKFSIGEEVIYDNNVYTVFADINAEAMGPKDLIVLKDPQASEGDTTSHVTVSRSELSDLNRSI